MPRPNGPADLNTQGGRIKWLRIQARETQTQLAVAVGVSRDVVANWETDRTPPTPEMAAALAGRYGVPASFLSELPEQVAS